MFFNWNYRPLVIFSVQLQSLEISEMLEKNTYIPQSADRHGAQPDNSSKLELPEERDGELMSRWIVFLQTLTCLCIPNLLKQAREWNDAAHPQSDLFLLRKKL